MNTTVKITKRDRYSMLIEFVNEHNGPAELAEFCKAEIALLDKKATKNKAVNAAKKEAPDALQEAVQAVLTHEWQTREDVLNQIEGEDLSLNKIGARLTKLVNAGVAEKAEQVVPATETTKRRTVMAYKLAEVDAEG